MDKKPGDLDKPSGFPKTVWVVWDSWGEYLDTTEDPSYGLRWMREARDGCGYAAQYELVKPSGHDYVPGQRK